jgi:hypothetical protein
VKSNQTSCTVSLPNAQESDPEQIFTFDRVFAPNSSQEEIFDRGEDLLGAACHYYYFLITSLLQKSNTSLRFALHSQQWCPPSLMTA